MGMGKSDGRKRKVLMNFYSSEKEAARYIGAHILGRLINRRTRELLHEDMKGFCASVPLQRVAELDYVLTPGRYVGLSDEDDEFNFAAQLVEEERLNKAIVESLARVRT